MKHEVYFAQIDYGGPIKIGSTINRGDRLQTIGGGLPFNVVHIGSFPGYVFCERYVQCWFRAQRIRGEWFEPTPELLRWAYQARAHQRVHQVPPELPRGFAAGSQAIRYRIDHSRGLVSNAAVAAATGRTEKAIEYLLAQPYINSRTILAGIAVAFMRAGIPIDFVNDLGVEYRPPRGDAPTQPDDEVAEAA